MQDFLFHPVPTIETHSSILHHTQHMFAVSSIIKEQMFVATSVAALLAPTEVNSKVLQPVNYFFSLLPIFFIDFLHQGSF